MEALLFAINAVLPIVLTVSLGYVLKKLGFFPAEFSKRVNTLVFRVFLPVMLFLNVYEIADLKSINLSYALYAVVLVFIIFLINIPLVKAVSRDSATRGALLQASFRSNFALIGIPLAESLFGSAGVAAAALLSAITIPSFNILAVISLSLFSGEESHVSPKKVALNIIKNPLIIGVLSGCLALGMKVIFERIGFSLSLNDLTPLYKLLHSLSSVATPLALLVIGAQFEFSAISTLKKEIIFGTLMRVVLVPLLGLGTAYLLFKDLFTGAQFASLVAVFATPVAVSSVPMAQEMKSNVELAGQLVIFTTIFSVFSVALAAFLLKSAGIF